MVIYYALGSVVLAAYSAVGRSVVRLAFRGIRLRWPLFADILRVGAVAALITVQTNLTIAIATGFVGAFGPAAIAGYGTGSRLEYLLMPLVFGLGGPLVAMVGTNIGAGRPRARACASPGSARRSLPGYARSSAFAAALSPRAWLSLFDTDPAMLDAGTRYLQSVGPFYGLFGLGMALYFASQGAGRLLWPLLANMARLVIAAARRLFGAALRRRNSAGFRRSGRRARGIRPDQCGGRGKRRLVRNTALRRRNQNDGDLRCVSWWSAPARLAAISAAGCCRPDAT